MKTALKDTAFYQFLKTNFEKGNFTNDDVVAIILPLLTTVSEIHNKGKVANLIAIDSIVIENDRLDIIPEELPVRINYGSFSKFFDKQSKVFEISEEFTHKIEIGNEDKNQYIDESVQKESDEETLKPKYLLNYKCYEFDFNHHDPISDIYVLGMILASIALHFDFTESDDLVKFVTYRKSMVFINPTIHPSISNIIYGMTELDRKKRWKDLTEIIEKLKNYREYNPETEYDLSVLIGSKKPNRNQYIHEKLRNRLFDNSRRNRLLYYKPNLKFLNLTVSSVPQVLNYNNIDPNSLFFWNQELSKKIINANSISLSKYIRFEDNPYISPTLDKIRLESNKDINEYGFSQLKLVLCFLNWYNTKENTTEKINSPLLLAPINLVKKKGLKDNFTIEFIDSEIEVNPVLANLLRDLYDIRLPETIQLSETSIEDIYNGLKAQIEKDNSGIELDYIGKPKIKLIHTQAIQTNNQYNKRNKKREAISDLRNIHYSYNQDDFLPYGLELFKQYIRPESSNLEFLINNEIKLSPLHFTPGKTIEREYYTLDDGDVNPFKWEFDTCNMVIGNFNYKKMSLVRDYNVIIDNKLGSQIFDNLFNPQANKEFKNRVEDVNTFTKTYNVVASDPTQNKAVVHSVIGESYIIQGPPGTGKSQTIANLVANFIANGKKILFVCEKRAALDVVYYRLKNQGLDELCCLIHDSQADKKEFILNLKKTFNDFTSAKVNLSAAENQRNQLIEKIDYEINAINEFHQFMKYEIPDSNLTIQNIFEILVANSVALSENEINSISDQANYRYWQRYKDALEKLYQINKDTNKSPYFCVHPLRHFSIENFINSYATADFKRNLESILPLANEISERLELIHFPTDLEISFSSINQFMDKCIKLLPFYENKVQELLDENSAMFKDFLNERKEIEIFENTCQTLKAKYPHWNSEISETDILTAFEIVSLNENKFFNFFNSSYKQAKKLVLSKYNIAKHDIKPKLSAILENKKGIFEIQKQIEEKEQQYENKYNLGESKKLLETIKEGQNQHDSKLGKYLESLDREDKNELKNLHLKTREFVELLNLYFDKITDESLSVIEQEVEKILAQQYNFQLYSSSFNDLEGLDKSLIDLIKQKPVNMLYLQSLLAQKTLQTYYAKNYEHKKFNMDLLHHSIEKIKKLYKELLAKNGNFIIEKQKDNVKKLIKKSELSVAGMGEKAKEEKRSITEGRKILENEFNKTIRYKSIRELATLESGQIIRELKPVWLMSPLSVSDTLPMDQNYFDVVVFDEASQITLEEGLPPIYRANQIIIVGDEMQMPPSNFFGSSSGNQDDLWLDEDEGDYFSLDADSFLTQGARKFPSIMLGWHYRSKHEALIGFSNASFYNNELLTIPDIKDHENSNDEIIIEDVSLASYNVNHLYDKPISYHYIKSGVYSNRANEQEAKYIANLVKELLSQKLGYSIGIVAFSMEQQNEIESAIQDICIQDKIFESLIEDEYKRIEDNQFMGLFVKNLENVQGDERDIIIMSTCYGYDMKGKMLMNFGPINKRGGEKRLNVLFSRAKKSMCVVSSIKYYDIKNEYNDGANYFRKYLQYAELVSRGQIGAANNVLSNILSVGEQPGLQIIVEQIQLELENRGFVIVKNIGQSKFKCHLGVKNNSDNKVFILGILVDDSIHYSNNDIIEQYILKPEILKQNGWKICQIYSKDWLDNRERVLKMIESYLKDELFFDEVEPIHFLPEPEIEEEVAIDSPLESESVFERYINTENTSNKFWEITTEGDSVIIQYGRIGTKGQRLIKVMKDEESAKTEMLNLINQKKARGYYKPEKN